MSDHQSRLFERPVLRSLFRQYRQPKIDTGLAATLRWFTAGGAIRIALRQLFFVSDIAIFVLKRDVKLQLTNYDNFCKTGNDVIDDAIIWVQDGNCKKWLERMLVLVRSTI